MLKLHHTPSGGVHFANLFGFLCCGFVFCLSIATSCDGGANVSRMNNPEIQWQHWVYRHRTKTNKTNNIDTVATLGIQPEMIREEKKSKKIFHIILQIAMNSWKSFIE